jgi:hypothetical protein
MPGKLWLLQPATFAFYPLEKMHMQNMVLFKTIKPGTSLESLNPFSTLIGGDEKKVL